MAAPAYQSSQTTTAALSGTVVITKPASLAVGDTMVAHIVSFDGGGVTTLAGWTHVTDDGQGFQFIFTKVATSADVAASNFTWTTGGSVAGGAITRLTGADVNAPADQSSSNQVASPVNTLTSGTITPNYPNTLFMIFTNHRTSSAVTVSTYAIATNNPTWTEAYDLDAVVSGTDYGFSMAYGSRPQTSASGTASAVTSANVIRGGLSVVDIISPRPTGSFLLNMI